MRLESVARSESGVVRNRRMEVFVLNARMQHLSELLNTVMMYEPGERKRELCCWKRQTLARERVDTPLEQGPRVAIVVKSARASASLGA